MSAKARIVGKGTDVENADAAFSRIDAISNLSSSHTFADACQREGDLFSQNQQTEHAEKMQWELEAWRLFPDTARSSTGRTSYRPMLTSEDGQVWPDPSSFSDAQWNHVSARAKATANDFVKAHYSDLVWFFRKHHQFAIIAIDAFQRLEEQLWNSAKSDDYRLSPGWVVALFRPLELAKQLHKDDSVQNSVSRVVQRINEIATKTYCNGAFLSAIDTMVQRRSALGVDQRRQMAEQLTAYSSELGSDYDWSIGILETVLTMGRSISDAKLVAGTHEQIANLLIGKAETERVESKLIAADTMGRAIVHLQAAGDAKHRSISEGLQKSRTDLLSDSESIFSTISSEFELNMTIADDVIETLIRESTPTELVPSVFLISTIYDRAKLRSAVDKQRADAPLKFMISHAVITDEGFVDFEAVGEEELFEYQSWQYVVNSLKMSSFYLRRCIDRVGDCWRIEALMSLFSQAPLVNPARLESIQSALERYFAQDHRAAVTLLTLEMEPIVRSVIGKIGLSAVVQSDPKNPKLQRAKSLKECLAIPEVIELFGERWVLAMQALLTQSGGAKLRHRIAHGLGAEEMLTQQTADLLICLLLHIANYRERTADEMMAESVSK